MKNLVSFGSDNHSGTHPAFLDAIKDCNEGFAPSYGTDIWSDRALELIKDKFGKETQAYFVFNGTAANVLSLRMLAKNYESVFCSDTAHLWVDECSAPEAQGIKLIPLPHSNGVIQIETLKTNLVRRGDQHFAQTTAVSLTQPTELGTCYGLMQIKEITTWAHKEGLAVHIDGARLANACVELGCNFKDLTTDLGIDIVSLGGTKNGMMFGEAVLVLNQKFANGAKYMRKQMGQLPSKTRFVAAQFSKYLENDLWKEIALHSVNMAELLYREVKGIPGVELTRPRESNAVFARVSQSWVKPLRDKFFFYVWDENSFECRWMTSWSTTEEQVRSFANALKEMR